MSYAIPAFAKLFLIVALSAFTFGAASNAAEQDDDQWLIGTWELRFDPGGAEKDLLIFKSNGDVISRGSDGNEYEGMYIVTPQGVKTVFTHEGQDVIATFHSDNNREVLKIVTSGSGEESIYKKVD